MSQTVKVKGYGRAVFPDHFTKEQMRTALRKKFNNAAESTAGALDAAATVGSAVVAEPVSGLAGIGSSIYNMDASKGADTVKAVQDAMTYQPRTAKGQEYLQNVSEFVEPVANLIGSASQNLGDKAYAATGSPTLAAAAYSVPTAIAEGVGLKGLNIARKPVSKADLYAVRMGGGSVEQSIDDLIAIEKAKYDEAVAPLKARYKVANQDERAEILSKSKELREALTKLEQKKYTDEIRASQKDEPKQSKQRDLNFKSYKGKAYHLTGADFDEFDFKKTRDNSIWFTTNKDDFSNPQSSAAAAAGKGRLIEVDLDLNKLAGQAELNKYTIDELISLGYDGAFIDGNVQIFNSGRVKLPSAKKPK